MSLITRLALAGVAASVLFSAAPALAETLNFTAMLSGAEEVPPVTTSATGTLEATFDTETKVLTWTVNYEGLSGDATAAHFHGPADPGTNAGPVVPVDGPLASPIMGMATLDDAQAADLQAGKWYFNIHTAANTGGEIRGQVTAPPAP